MAKTLGSTTRIMQLQWDGASPSIRFVSYEDPVDTVDQERLYRKTGAPLANPTPRVLTAEELSGTVQVFLNSVDSEINTAKGIS